MPPVTKAGGTQFRKDVEFVAKDEDEQVASGIVMVPDKADLQNDFAREETIRGFSDQFETFEEANQAQGGIMHAVWPDGWMDLERNEVLDEAEEIGGQTVDAGAWVQDWKVNNSQLWDLVDASVLEGYSIGAIQVGWEGPYDPDEDEEVDDVDTSEIPDDELVWELTDGIIREVSAVDIPAVPDAQILEAKGMEKRLAEHIGNQEAFVEEAMERGHSEDDAERLWDVLNEAMSTDGASDPGKQSMFAKAGKAFLSALSGSDDDQKTSEAQDTDTDKAGQTLSRANTHREMASIDASLDVLQDAGVDHGMTRFTDREDIAFDLTEHSASEWDTDEDEDEDEEGDEEGAPSGDTDVDSAPFGTDDTDDSDTENADDTNMSEDNTEETEPPEWAKDLQNEIEEQSKRIDDLAEDDEEKSEDAWEDAPEWAKELKESQDKNADRIDAISKQTGTDTQQLGKSGEEEEKESGYTLDPRKAR